MSISIEKIEELKKRAMVSYEEAKNLLERHNGDIVEALIELEKTKKLKCCTDSSEHITKVKTLFKKGNKSKFIVTRKGEIIVNVPINFLIVSIIFGFHLALLSLILIFATGCKMSIKKPEGVLMDVDDAIIDMASKVKNNAEKFVNNHQSSQFKNENNSNTYNNSSYNSNNSNAPSSNTNNISSNSNCNNTAENNSKKEGIKLEKEYNEFTVE